MQRGEAIQVLRKIGRVCSENFTPISSVSLIAPSDDNEFVGYQLKIGTKLDEGCRESLIHLLKENCLELEENKGYITIFKHN